MTEGVWKDVPGRPEDGDEFSFLGRQYYIGADGQRLASVIWYREKGPFYAFAVDPSDLQTIRRIGPHLSLAGARERCMEGIAGKIGNLTRRAGYRR